MDGNVIMSELSLPSLRNGKAFEVLPLRFGGIRRMIKAEEESGTAETAAVMILETLRRTFPNIGMDEVDALEQEDFLKLMPLVVEANKGITDADFQSLPATIA